MPEPETVRPSGSFALADAARARGRNTRERLLAVAMALFCEHGYLAVSIEQIADAAGVTRMTFYRHFQNKADLTSALFQAESAIATRRYVAIGEEDFRDSATVSAWIAGLFEADQANRRLIRVFTQATADEGGFTERAQDWIRELVALLGNHIPAFAVDRDVPDQARRWLEAWLLLYEILDQSNHAATGSGVAADPLVIDILTERFVRFVGKTNDPARMR